MWKIDRADSFSRPLKKFAKRHRQETQNVMDNAQAYVDALNDGSKPQQIVRGFVHDEPDGVKAFDESGPGAHKKATRLYAFPDEETETLYLITIGGKSGQDRDIERSSNFVKQLLQDREEDVQAQDAIVSPIEQTMSVLFARLINDITEYFSIEQQFLEERFTGNETEEEVEQFYYELADKLSITKHEIMTTLSNYLEVIDAPEESQSASEDAE